jgi:hypothetical protein
LREFGPRQQPGQGGGIECVGGLDVAQVNGARQHGHWSATQLRRHLVVHRDRREPVFTAHHEVRRRNDLR